MVTGVQLSVPEQRRATRHPVDYMVIGEHRTRGDMKLHVANLSPQGFMIDNAEVLDDLKVPPGNRLEALKGDRTGQHSIRINDQFRICFRWNDGSADDVEIVDFH